MPSVNSLRGAAKRSHPVQLSGFPSAGQVRAVIIVLLTGSWREASQIALPELGFETQVVFQPENRLSALDACVPGNKRRL